ncbi:MAG: GGDEF domain-containing protein [Pseudomonadota bacterium]|uniref:GGDEF domain-containing protein n=1 Tax=Marisediminitalea TaxID=2662254 RepID=UPI0020CFA130|nr:GGDEF domain-containing protein [Marisediminitalea aggregata]MCP3864487.1 GGDEF domain-containing protein [Aestuariibacter sp.]MEC8227638.1 GGDEF domain-containing protein [Pseudomonadota bacterium]MCP4528406.1 GGDEF domain-containing protein [Aestuariibacter sp.]MCP4945928.1 GGDEF domain-containing protein [Aestuariibacter sp.]MCP9479878.1 GGDEF domain-containing protein [Marisediminitalea aggregata]
MRLINTITDRVTRSVNWLITSGCKQVYDEDANRKIIVINLFAMVGMSITFALGISAMIDNDRVLGIVLLSSSALFGLCKALLLHSKVLYNHVLAPFILVVSLAGLMLYLVITGGVANTGPLWIYVLPPVAMFFAGVVYGVITVAVFITLCSYILFAADGWFVVAHYTTEFKLRLLYSFATVTFLSAFYEHSRQTSFNIVKDLSDKFEKQAQQDMLTRLPNRRGIQQFIEFESARARRQKKPLTLILCDIDRFKRVNDQYGHDGGDVVLKHVSDLFKASIREQDGVARWGGEEFLFVLPDTEESNAVVLAEKVRETLATSPVELQQKKVVITASFGVAQIDFEQGLDKALTLADKALYKAKEKGRNKVLSASSLARL